LASLLRLSSRDEGNVTECRVIFVFASTAAGSSDCVLVLGPTDAACGHGVRGKRSTSLHLERRNAHLARELEEARKKIPKGMSTS
jgi:hypothetical protein